jgi:hypothetical protein
MADGLVTYCNNRCKKNIVQSKFALKWILKIPKFIHNRNMVRLVQYSVTVLLVIQSNRFTRFFVGLFSKLK